MNPTRSPLILAGQLYYNGQVNEYLIVTSNNRGQVSYEGVGFKGQAEDITFIERFQPVNPNDVDEQELSELLAFCPPGTTPQVGYILD